MNINEFKIKNIIDFTTRINREFMPCNYKRIIIKAYASTLRINLTDKMIDDII